MIHYRKETSKSFDEAVLAIKDSLKNYGFGVLWELNFKDKLREKGLEFDKNFKILEACNPGKAKKVLDEEIEAGYFLPCKVAIYEKNDKIYIGMIKPTTLIDMMDSDHLVTIAEEVEDQLVQAIDEAV